MRVCRIDMCDIYVSNITHLFHTLENIISGSNKFTSLIGILKWWRVNDTDELSSYFRAGIASTGIALFMLLTNLCSSANVIAAYARARGYTCKRV